MVQTDFLVIGSGIAGLSYALKVAQHFSDRQVLVITKTRIDETNTKYAQGGIAGVTDFEHDSFDKHIQDTLVAGDGLCNPRTVEIGVTEGPERINEIIEWGTRFDKDSEGDFKLGREGGHSEFRILHHKDVTGREIERALLETVGKQKNIIINKHWFVLDLITQHHLGYLVTKSTPDIECYGVYALDQHTNKIVKILSRLTLLATGGNGQAYRTTPNPKIATGDGVAMAYRAKGRIENMEFIQFHPTALYEPGVSPSFLITEAVRGDGGILRNNKEEAFMSRYDERKDLAPRDIVARAIDSEIKRTGTEHVYLDCRHMDLEKFTHHFPNIYQKCLSIGIDPAENMIPVAPAAHYSCGGIKVDEWGHTSINYLYACGECSSTGLHGANRLASNSLLEALVFAHRIYQDAVEKFEKNVIPDNIPDWNEHGVQLSNEDILVTHNVREMQKLMSDYVGIVRSDFRLDRAMRRLHLLYEETEEFYKKTKLSVKLCELRNLIQVSYIVVKSAMLRKESRGLHYTTDYQVHAEKVHDTVF